MNDITVVHREGDGFAVFIRDHVVQVDQPYWAGGQNVGPTPVELFVAGLAACAAHYGRRYLAAHGQADHGLEVTAKFSMSGAKPARVTRIRLSVRPPTQLDDEHFAGLLDAVERCTVHNSLGMPPRVEIGIESPAGTVASRGAPDERRAGQGARGGAVL